MDIGLCMVVKNEANRIARSLSGIIDLFSDLVIIDTGSIDDTRSILKKEFGIVPLYLPIDGKNDPCQARNFGHELLKTPWVMNLDADEIIDRADIMALQRITPSPGAAGYFCAWNTHKKGVITRDYKLSIFQKNCIYIGKCHANIQYGLRQENKKAYWLDCCTIMHYPEFEKYAWKSERYKQNLIDGIQEKPDWFRYHWFLGYTYFCENNFKDAEHFLLQAARSLSMNFPVECLNSRMVLADIYAKQNKRERLEFILIGAMKFYEQVADDFEVKVNFRMRQWIEDALKFCHENSLEKITIYNFSY